MKKALIITASILIVGCSSLNPYTGEKKTSNTTKGVIGGAIAGAITGQLVGGDSESTITGLAAGAGLGAGLGYYFDRQESKLRAELESTGVGIKRVGEGELQLVMPNVLTFNVSSSSLSEKSYEVLDSIVKVLKEYNKTIIEVSGHTDNTGSKVTNDRLSQERANEVYDYLVGNGVKKERMSSIGVGSNKPIASNSTTEGRGLNRRVEIIIIGQE